MDPTFQELERVKAQLGETESIGYVIAVKQQEGSWLYKVSLPDPDKPEETFDNWYPESALSKTK